MKKNLNIMIKPSSSKCNLNCKYCFYHSIADARETRDYGFMSHDTLSNIIDRCKEFCGEGICTLGFQGGEPLLIGLDFYRRLINLIGDDTKGTKFKFSIQTNGTLITDEWAKFLKDNNFLVGISLDGSKEQHDLNRVNSLNNGTYKDVKKGIESLKKYNVDFNILTVVTSSLSRKIESTYKYFKKENYKYLQFIPCLDSIETKDKKENYSLEPKVYTSFLKKLFDLWYEDVKANNYISIRFFENILLFIMGEDYEACDMRGICSCQHIIESDGTVYPCDFYTYEKYSIGNINLENFDLIHSKGKTINFVKESFNNNIKCKSCKYKDFCRGGCKRHRKSENGNMNIFCESYYEFYSYSIDRFFEIARHMKER